jgi:DNA-binding NarL/FixJ family response regulator
MPANTSHPAKTRVFLVDDHPLVRKGIADCLHNEPDMIVCGEAANSADAMNGIARARPDLVVVDLSLPGRDGIELIKEIKSHHPRLQVLVLSMHDESLYARRALRAGASGYLMKSNPAHALIQGIRDVLAGKIVVSGQMRELLLRSSIGLASRTPLQELSDREMQVFRLFGEGCSCGRIAAQLHLSVKTVETHRSNICRKLALKNAIELVRYAAESTRSETTFPPP